MHLGLLAQAFRGTNKFEQDRELFILYLLSSHFDSFNATQRTQKDLPV